MIPLFEAKPDITWTAIEPLIWDGSLIVDSAYCYEHDSYCIITAADEAVAGLPCPEWSSQNSSACDIDDAYCALTAGVWLTMRRRLQERRIVYENVIPGLDRILSFWSSFFLHIT